MNLVSLVFPIHHPVRKQVPQSFSRPLLQPSVKANESVKGIELLVMVEVHGILHCFGAESQTISFVGRDELYLEMKRRYASQEIGHWSRLIDYMYVDAFAKGTWISLGASKPSPDLIYR